MGLPVKTVTGELESHCKSSKLKHKEKHHWNSVVMVHAFNPSMMPSLLYIPRRGGWGGEEEGGEGGRREVESRRKKKVVTREKADWGWHL